MQETYFSKIKSMLLDRRQEWVKAREECSSSLESSQDVWDRIKGAGVVVGVVGSLGIIAFPSLGASLALSGAVSYFLSKEMSVIAKNGKDLLDSNLVTRTVYVLTPEIFAEKIFKGTHSAPVMSHLVVMALKVKTSKTS